MGTSPPDKLKQPTPKPMPHLPRTPPLPGGDNQEADDSEIDSVPSEYVYVHALFPSAQNFNRDAYAMDRKWKKDFNPDLLIEEGISTG
jgi:hypothetical protein